MIDYVFPVKGFRGTVSLHHGTHQGASDLFAPRGTDVVAMAAGRVDGAGSGPISGNYVSMRGNDGLDYWYAHGDRFPAVRSGQWVPAGTYLFGVGDTGNAAGTGPHLHIGGGYGIADGVGPSGGAGINFNFVMLLRKVLSGDSSGPTPTPTPVPHVPAVGDVYRVTATGLRVRSKPGLSGAVVMELPKGAACVLHGKPTTLIDGHAWVRVAEGYVALTYLEYVSSAKPKGLEERVKDLETLAGELLHGSIRKSLEELLEEDRDYDIKPKLEAILFRLDELAEQFGIP